MRKVRLGDIANINISGIDKKTKDGEQAIRLCNFTDVYYNWAITKNMYDGLMQASASESDIETFSLCKGQVAITKDSETRDDIGVATYIADDFEDVVLGYHCALIAPKDDIPEDERIYGKYLNALLHTKYAQKYFSNNATGSGQRYTLSKETVEDMPVYLPYYKEQVRIGDYLSDIDKKIEINHLINSELEVMAKQIYDYWFVQYDFPDEDGKPYKSSGGKMIWNETLKREIPDGWSVDVLENLLKLEDSKRVPLSGKERESMHGEYPYYGATGIMDYINKYIFDGDYLLLAEDGSTSDDKGYPIVQYIWGKTWVNNHAHIIRPMELEQISFYYFLLKTIPAVMIETGSIQKKISQQNLLRYSTLCPPKNIVNVFCKFASKNRGHQKNIIDEIKELQALRDYLLPLLMNGQITIKE